MILNTCLPKGEKKRKGVLNLSDFTTGRWFCELSEDLWHSSGKNIQIHNQIH